MSAVLYVASQRPFCVLKIGSFFSSPFYVYYFLCLRAVVPGRSVGESPAALVPKKVLLALYTLVVSKAQIKGTYNTQQRDGLDDNSLKCQ